MVIDVDYVHHFQGVRKGKISRINNSQSLITGSPMAIDVEYIHNGKVCEVLTALANTMQIEKCPIAPAASDHVWSNPAASLHHVRFSWSWILVVEVQAFRHYLVEQGPSHPQRPFAASAPHHNIEEFVDGLNSRGPRSILLHSLSIDENKTNRRECPPKGLRPWDQSLSPMSVTHNNRSPETILERQQRRVASEEWEERWKEIRKQGWEDMETRVISRMGEYGMGDEVGRSGDPDGHAIFIRRPVTNSDSDMRLRSTSKSPAIKSSESLDTLWQRFPFALFSKLISVIFFSDRVRWAVFRSRCKINVLRSAERDLGSFQD